MFSNEGHSPRPGIMLAPNLSANSPSKAFGPRKRIARMSDIGGPFSSASGYAKVTFSHRGLVSAVIVRISNGCAIMNSSLKNPRLCKPCLPKTKVQSLNSENSSSNSSHTLVIVVVLLDQPVEFSTGVRAYSIFASNGSDSSDSSKNSCESPTPYASTVVITRDARNTPATTARPLSLPRQAPTLASLSLLGNSDNL